MALTRNWQFDALLELHDGTLKAASGVGTEGILDLGEGNSILAGDMVINVTACEVASNDEDYDVLLQGSSTADFSADVQTLARAKFGAQEVLGTDVDVDTQLGVYAVGFYNHGINGTSPTAYRYLRCYIDIAGTIATGFAAQVFLSQSKA